MKNLLKSFGIITLIVIIGFSILACTTNGGVYDKSTPPEQRASLVIPRGGALSANIIVAFNGNQVNWSDTSMMGQFGGKFLVDIPSGTHTLVGMKVGMGQGSAQNPTITYDFLAGHTYRVEVKGDEIIVTDITKK